MLSVLGDALVISEELVDLGFDIYESLAEYPEVVCTRGEFEALLRHELVGQVFNPPIRTRAKLAKQAVAAALGYPVPGAFRKVKPRFPGQDLDVYVQLGMSSHFGPTVRTEIGPTSSRSADQRVSLLTQKTLEGIRNGGEESVVVELGSF